MKTNEIVLKGNGLRKVYGSGEAEVEALCGVDIELRERQLIAVRGPSGSGKSTLMHLLSGLDRPTSGNVFLDDVDLSSLKEKELAALRASSMGFVLQRDNLVPQLTIRENVALPLLLSGRSRNEAMERADEMLRLVRLAHRAHSWPNEVSGGEAQRAAVARACGGRPKVIFADEPTGALDSAAGKVVLELIRTITQEVGAATFLVTHDPAVAASADEVLTLEDGVFVGSN